MPEFLTIAKDVGPVCTVALVGMWLLWKIATQSLETVTAAVRDNTEALKELAATLSELRGAFHLPAFPLDPLERARLRRPPGGKPSTGPG